VAALVAVFREVRRVLADDGTLWLNLGDSYASDQKGSGGQGASGLRRDGREEASRVRSADLSIGHQKFSPRRIIHGLKSKDLIGIPWRVAFALQADGWYLRSDIIWSKPNPMPESVADRPTKAHEYIFLLSKSARYFYDAAAIQEPLSAATRERWGALAGQRINPRSSAPDRNDYTDIGGASQLGAGETRNKRSVWHVATQPYSGAHFATFPEALIEPCILAGCPVGGTVLDPFTGSGTTGAVAIRHQRNFIGCELNADYIALAERRIVAVAPLFSSGDVQGATSLTAATDNGQQQSIF
jgi:DNA modification methylase